MECGYVADGRCEKCVVVWVAEGETQVLEAIIHANATVMATMIPGGGIDAKLNFCIACQRIDVSLE